ncbi:MAG: virulence factor SrfB [Chromatiales bacterium]|nr:virulence factor SrfB [Chromatiales bacterium]
MPRATPTASTLAFDTQLLPTREGRPYLAPSPLDMQSGEEFALSDAEADTGWFLEQEWVREWLHQRFHAFELRRRAPRRVDETELRASPDAQAAWLDRADPAATGGAAAAAALHLRGWRSDRPAQPAGECGPGAGYRQLPHLRDADGNQRRRPGGHERQLPAGTARSQPSGTGLRRAVPQPDRVRARRFRGREAVAPQRSEPAPLCGRR